MALGACSIESAASPSPDPFAAAVGATRWMETEDPAPDNFGRGVAAYESPEQLMRALIEQAQSADGIPDGALLFAEVVDRAESSAVANMRITGVPDDSILGQEVRLQLFRGPGGWYVDGTTYRIHCRRGVVATGDACT